MKINKLLFFLLAVFSLNSCVEYVDNGTKPDGSEQPEERKFTAEQANPDDAKYVGDTFEFKAMLNGVNVTATTKFKVNGSAINGKTYVPHKTGSHSVIATMDDLEATFRFTVLEKDEEEPEEPTGNRIEYDGDWKPVTNTFWIGYGNPATPTFTSYPLNVQGNTVPCTKWLIVSMDNTNPNNAENLYYIDEVFIPIDTSTTPPSVKYPHQATDFYYTASSSASFVFDKNNIPMTSNDFNFISGTIPTSGKGTADYTATGQLNNSKEGKLFWNGEYTFQIIADTPKAKGISKLSNIDFTKSQNTNVTKINLKK